MEENKPTILIVDDTEINIDILMGILKKYDVIPATSGEEALVIAKEEAVDLVLLDIVMPEMDGYTVCEMLKADEKTRNIPVMFITVKDGEEDVKRGFDLGIVDYVTKPFNPVELLARVKTHLELKQYRDNLEKQVSIQVEESRIKDKMVFQHSKQAAIGELLMHIAHQWKQPLSELGSMNLSMFGKLHHGQGMEKDELEEICQKTEQILKFMSETVETFQDFYRPHEKNSFFDIAHAIHQSVSIIDATCNYHKIAIQIDKKQSPKAYGNENEYAQVILNLLTNAKDAFVRKGIADPKITITIDTEGEQSKVVIEDNAGGIDDEVMEKLFDPFNGSNEGIGIGLYMSRAILEKHKGLLEVKNSEAGAVFTVIL